MADGTTTRGLVLGGGGIAGIAWETGVLVGLADAGVDVGTADTVVGTSAGSVVGGLLRSGLLQSALEATLAEEEPADTAVPDGVEGFLDAIGNAVSGLRDEVVARARVGALALASPAEAVPSRLPIFERLLGRSEWPEGRLVVTAVDTADGSFRTFTSDDEAPYPLAVSASCAVPIVYPTVEIGDRRYMDGGVRSGTNADLVAGHDRVLVLACNPEPPLSPLGPQLPAVQDDLTTIGQVAVIEPDAASRAAFGTNPLDPAVRTACAAAGRAQGAAEAERIRAIWG